jgi:hypothetical protein
MPLVRVFKSNFLGLFQDISGKSAETHGHFPWFSHCKWKVSCNILFKPNENMKKHRCIYIYSVDICIYIIIYIYSIYIYVYIMIKYAYIYIEIMNIYIYTHMYSKINSI